MTVSHATTEIFYQGYEFCPGSHLLASKSMAHFHRDCYPIRYTTAHFLYDQPG